MTIQYGRATIPKAHSRQPTPHVPRATPDTLLPAQPTPKPPTTQSDSTLEQGLDGVNLRPSRCEEERRAAVGILCMYISASSEERGNDGGMAIVCGPMQASEARWVSVHVDEPTFLVGTSPCSDESQGASRVRV